MTSPALFPVLLAWLIGSIAAHAATATDDPTHEEIAILALYNAHRRQPGIIDVDILNDVRNKKLSGDVEELSHFLTMIKPLSPVVFNAHLTATARAILKAGVKPEIGKTYEVIPAMSAAGYTPVVNGLALVAQGCTTPAIAYGKAITFKVRYTYVKQLKMDIPIFARADALRLLWREAGVAVATANGTTSLVIVLGTGSAKRYVGGVAYRDNDRDFMCDAGEGVGGIGVRAGTASTTTGPHGAWWLALDTHDAVDITFSLGSDTATRPIAPGKDNELMDWRLPVPGDFKTADRLIAACAVSPNDEGKQRGALAALYFGSRGLCLDDARQNAIAKLVQPVRDHCDSLIADVQTAMASDPKDWKKQRSDLEKPWNGAISAWFKEADATYQQRDKWKTVLAAQEEQQAKLAKPLLQPLRKQIADTSDPIFAANLRDWLKDLERISPAPDQPPRRK